VTNGRRWAITWKKEKPHSSELKEGKNESWKEKALLKRGDWKKRKGNPLGGGKRGNVFLETRGHKGMMVSIRRGEGDIE